MEELKNFLLSHPHVKNVYFVEEVWSIHKPNAEHKIKTREELLSSEKVEDKVKEIKKTK
jgi:hypothetical protein